MTEGPFDARPENEGAERSSLFQFIRRAFLAAAMTLEYEGRFPRRKMFPLYWRLAEKIGWRHF